MKVILIGTTAASQINFRKELIKSLTAKDVKVYCFAIDYTDETKRAVINIGGEPIDYKLNRTGKTPFSDLFSTYELYKKIKIISPDLVISYFSKPAIFGTIASKLAKVPKIYAMLEGLGFCFTEQKNGQKFKTKLLKWIQIFLYKLSLPLANGVILLNSDDKKDLIDRYHIKVNVFIWGGIGVNLQELAYSEADLNKNLSFIFIGRLIQEKGIHEFISAAREIKTKYNHIDFVVLGQIDKENPGKLTEEQLNNIIESGLITYPGFVTDIIPWIKNSHIFVLPSYREGLPRSTQEAMAIGRPIITTNTPGCKDTVINGKNGFLVEPWSINDLVEKFTYFIENPDAINKMGKESFLLAQERFDKNITNKKLLDYINIYD